MGTDEYHGKLRSELARYNIPLGSDVEELFYRLGHHAADTARLVVELTGLDTYVQNWGEQAGIWIILAVTRMIAEILEDYSAAAFGCVPPRTFAVVTSETNQQEIGHRFMTAYQEIYDVLLRTQRKPSSPVWHRRAVTNTFPELSLEVIPTGALASDTPDDAGAE